MVLAYRNPLLTAKSLLTLDTLSKGRVILGVAAGYLKPEFAALGVDFDERNALTDEAIDVIRLALTTDARRVRGPALPLARDDDAPAGRASTPPIWIGGNSRAAIRRAVDRGDGWVPFPNPAAAARAVRTPLLTTIDDLAERLAYLHTYASEQGRPAPIDICFHPFSLTEQYERERSPGRARSTPRSRRHVVRAERAARPRPGRVSRRRPSLRRRRHGPDLVTTKTAGARYVGAMDVIRTPDERFAGLPGFPFAPNYVEVPSGNDGTLRVHYLDEGPRDAPVVLLHARRAVVELPVPHDDPGARRRAGLRAVAPDLVGFGRSDKPTRSAPTTRTPRHVEWMRSPLFDALDLRDVTFVGQDWGGLVGLRLVGEHPDRFARVVAANTFLPTGDTPPGDAFLAWQRFSQTVDDFPVGFIVNSGCTTDLAEDVVAAYDAPFPDEQYKAGARQFPMLVPTSPDDPAAAANRAAWEVLRTFDRPFLTRVLGRGRDHARRRPCVPARRPGLRRANRTRRSPAVGTSCRRTEARSSRWSWPRS